MEKKKIIFILFREYEQGHLLENELQIQIWMDATLGELTRLTKDINPDVRCRGTQFDFSIVTADDSRNRYYLNPLRPDVAIWQHFVNITLGFILK